MKDFPKMVFVSPGKYECQGGTYGYELVQDEKELESALKAGFFESVPGALENASKPKKAEKPVEVAPKTVKAV